jgi:lycopene cyclase CruP
MAFLPLFLPLTRPHKSLSATTFKPATRAVRRRRHRTAATTSASATATTTNHASPISPRVLAFLAGATDGDSSEGLRRAEAAYERLRADGGGAPREVVTVHSGPAPASDGAVFDVVVAGGTLGVFLAHALQLRGFRTAIVERGCVVGRVQEWNVSRAELAALTRMGLVGEDELEACIVSEWNPSRVAFQTAPDAPPAEQFVEDVLNCGVSPAALIAAVRVRYEAAGGAVLERRTITAIAIHDDAAVITTAAASTIAPGAQGAGGGGLAGAALDAPAVPPVRARLLVDCMGSFSPVVAQARGGARPDGVCVTVGACVEGAAERRGAPSDLIAAIDPVSPATAQQSFWETFPAAGAGAGGGPLRTAYMFQYGPCSAARPGLAATLDEFLDTLPRYLGAPLEDLHPTRVLFGFFPAYRASPIRTPFPRIFFAGDAGGTQSPVSFGGFGSLLRHLPRLAPALADALTSTPALRPHHLRQLSPYLPSTSAAWLFASAMSSSTPSPPLLGPYGINKLLAANMGTMARLGPRVQRPFLQDVVQAGGLARTLAAMVASDPVFAAALLPHVGVLETARFAGHFAALAAYALAARVVEAAGWMEEGEDGAEKDAAGFRRRRIAEALHWGSGRDHVE